MPLISHLIHTCTIQRYTHTQSARGAATKTASTVLTKVPCRLVYKTQRRVDLTLGLYEQTQTRLIISAGTEVDEDDEITNVRYKNSADLVDSATYRVDELLKRHGKKLRHKSLLLSKVE